jgi:hypothetical protein
LVSELFQNFSVCNTQQYFIIDQSNTYMHKYLINVQNLYLVQCYSSLCLVLPYHPTRSKYLMVSQQWWLLWYAYIHQGCTSLTLLTVWQFLRFITIFLVILKQITGNKYIFKIVNMVQCNQWWKKTKLNIVICMFFVILHDKKVYSYFSGYEASKTCGIMKLGHLKICIFHGAWPV